MRKRTNRVRPRLEILEDRRLLSGTSSVLPELAPPAMQHVSSPSDDSEAAASHKAERDDSAQHSESDWSPAQSIRIEDTSTSSEDHNSSESTHDTNERESESKHSVSSGSTKSESDTEESDKTTPASSTDVNDDTKESKSASAVQTEHESEDSPSAVSTTMVASQNASSGSLTATGSSVGSEREDDSSQSSATPVASNSGSANPGGTEAGDDSSSESGQANQIASNSDDNRQSVSPPSTSQQDDSVENHAVASGASDTGSPGSSDHTGASAEVQPAVNSAGKSADPVAHQNAPAANGIVTVATVQSPVQAAEPSAARDGVLSAAISGPRTQDGTTTPASDSGDSQLARAARLDLPAAQGAAAVNNGSSAESAEDVHRGDSLTLANATADDPLLGPVGADLLAGSPVLPLESVQAGIQSFLRELDHLGSAMIAAPSGVSLTWWLVSALAAASAFEIARRQMRRGQAELAGNLAQEPMFSWFPEGNDDSGDLPV